MTTKMTKRTAFEKWFLRADTRPYAERPEFVAILKSCFRAGQRSMRPKAINGKFPVVNYKVSADGNTVSFSVPDELFPPQVYNLKTGKLVPLKDRPKR